MKCKLSDFIEINPKEVLLKKTLAKKVAMEKLAPYCREISGYEIEAYTGGSKFRNKDTIMARITPCLENGKIAQVNILDKNEVGFGSTEFIVLRAKKDIADPDYIYYLTISELVRIPAIKSMVGSSGRQRVQTDVVENLEIDLPDLGTQKKIAKILSALDDKIECNNQINKNLEEQAQALFKSWFIDFEPFNGLMPEDWCVGKIKDILKLKRNSIKAGEDKELPYLPIEVIPMNSFTLSEFRPNSEAKSSLIKFSKNDIIIGAMRVYFHRVVIAPCDGITRTTCFTLTPYNKEYLAFGLLCCNQKDFIDYAQSTSKGSTMPYAVWENGLGDKKIFIPTRNVASGFNRIILPILQQIQSTYFQNKALKELRDTLLPKLMSGELDVSDIDI